MVRLIDSALRELIERHGDSAGALPAEVETRARWLVLDTLGCAIAGSRSAQVQAWLHQHRLRADPYGTAVDPARGPAAGAAMALAMGACWDEACEGHARAHGRPGVAVLAALWPHVSELTWDQFVRALVVGYEVGARMGAVLRIGPGMHVDANWPSLGAAAAAACALGLDSEHILTAVNIAACQLPLSLYRPITTGDSARNTYLGHAAMLGRMAAQAAAAGISAPHDAVDEHLRVAYGAQAAAASMAPVDTFEILSGYVKEYAAVRHVHYGARAALELRRSAPAESIRGIELWTYSEALTYCGIRAPATALQAQFSLSFGVAAMLRCGHLDPDVYASPLFTDPLMRALEKKVVVHVEPAWTPQHIRAARLRLELSDGHTVEHVITAVRGDASLPWTESDLTAKFARYCAGSLSAHRSAELARHILHAPPDAAVFPTAR